MHGSFFWYDVMTTDTKAAQKFYTEVIGWVCNRRGRITRFCRWTGRASPVSCRFPRTRARQGRGRAGWATSPSTTSTRPRRTSSAQGARSCASPRTSRESSVFSRGRSAGRGVPDRKGPHARCTSGACANSRLAPWVGTSSTLRTGRRRLRADLRLNHGRRDRHGPDGHIPVFATGSDAVGGMMNKPAEIPVPFWGYYFNVATLDAAIDRAASAGRRCSAADGIPGGMWIANA